MSGAEVAHRLGKAARSATSLLEISHPGAAPVADLSRPEHPFLPPLAPDQAPDAGWRAVIEEAERIVAGRHAVFDLGDCHLGDPPEWNRDPLTLRLAPWRAAASIDYRDEREVGNIKYLWEPNRHLHLATLAQAHALTGDEQYARTIRRHLDSWIAQCPVGRGPNWVSSLELGIRLINWSIVWQLLGGRSAAIFATQEGREFRDRWLASIFHHARSIVGNLSRFSSANNHLIGEAAGVYVAASTWPLWPQMRAWGARCRGILERECLQQNASDGGNREQALAYQQFVLDFLVIAGLAARAAGEDFAPAYWQRIEKMIDFIAALTDVAGNVPMIGDADDGFVVRLSRERGFCPFRSLVATGAVLFDRADLAAQAHLASPAPARADTKTRTLLGADASQRLEALRSRARAFVAQRAFAESGYFLLGEGFGTAREVRLLCDAGPLGYLSIAAHGHADALAVLLSIGGHEILIDPGTFAYHTDPQWRRYFRSTRAHNTVVVDDLDQSEQRGSFMWSEHAGARCVELFMRGAAQYFAGEHDGYARLRDPVIHRRGVCFEPHGIEIADTLRCAGAHRICRRWHFPENARVTLQDDGEIRVDAGAVAVAMTPLEPLERAALHSAGTPQEGGWVSRRFGVKIACTSVGWYSRVDGGSSAPLRTRIVWTFRDASPVPLRRVP